MLIVKSRAWGEIAKFYRNLVEKHGWNISPMLCLTEAIAASHYAQGVHATTSHATLCVSQHPEFEFDRNMLRIDFEDGRFIFRYKESPYFPKEWEKVCEADEGFATFEHVMRRLKWFLE